MELIIKEKEIQKRVEELAADIVKEHKGTGDIMPPVMICGQVDMKLLLR